MPSSPFAFHPQQHALAASVTPQVYPSPALIEAKINPPDTAMGVALAVVVPSRPDGLWSPGLKVYRCESERGLPPFAPLARAASAFAFVRRAPPTAIDQPRWVDSALEMFGSVFGGATAYPKAKGIWRDDERGGALVKDEPVVVHCYTTPVAIQDARNLAELGSFCRKIGREARQGEVGLVVGDEYFAIRDFAEE